jgi:phage tail sheath protein FI
VKATRVVLLVVGVVGGVVVAKKYLSPGVYVQEVPSTPTPIPGVGTSTVGRVSDDPEKPEKPAKP